MVAQSIVILSLLITYALSAPTGCIESCISYVKQYQTQTSGGLSQTASHLQGLDYSKPGTWSEHNDYDIDNGHGKVHEERGQYVTGPKTVRYYRKNSSSSYSTGYPNGEILSDFEYQNNRHGIHLPNTQEVFNSHNTYNQMGNSESVAQHKYNKIQSQQHTRSSYTKGERLEDLGEYSGRSQVIPQSTSNLNTQILQEPYHFNGQHGNWSTVDSYKTDGGRGHVFEEEGQYVSGPQKVRYYKRNYTSSYSSSDGIPIPKITKIGMHDIHQKLEKIEKEIGQEFKHISTAEAVGSTNIGQAHIRSHDLSIDNMHNINNNNYRRQHNHRNSLPMTHNEEQHSSDIRNEHLPYRNPYQNTYGANSYSTYERHEEYAQKLQPTSQLINPTSGYTSVLNTGNSGYNRNIYSGSTSQQQTDNYQQAEILDAHQSRQIAQTQTFLDNLRNNAQSQSSRIQSGMQGVSHYKEHWNASHTKEVSIPQHTTDISHMNQHSLQYNNNQYDNRHNLHQGIQQQDSYLHQFKEDGFTHGKKMLDKLISGVDTVDCDYNSQYTQSTSQYSRKYKRHAKYGKQDEVQQTQNKYINDDLTQQTSRKLEFGPDSQQSYQPWKPQGADQQLEDFTQKTGESDDLTQQTSGKLEFGQDSQQSYQPWKPQGADQQLRDFTQKTGESDDLTQQTSGKLEFGQDSQQSYQPWKPQGADQQLGDFAQKTGESDEFTQQTSGKLEFGQDSQQSYQPWKPQGADQQLEDFTQKTGESDDFTQQTSGKLEFDQDSQQYFQPWKPESASQQLGDFTQKRGESDDLIQQSSGKVEFGQNSQQSHQSWKPQSASQQLEDFTQETEKFDDFTQQNSGKLEIGQDSQQSYQPWKPQGADQQLGDFTQKTGESDDFTQQTSGKLEFGQDSQQSFEPWKPQGADQQLGDFTQKTGESDDFTQQTSGKLEFGQDSQQSFEPWKPQGADQQLGDFAQKTGESDDFTQQTSGKLEFGQDLQQSYQPWKPQGADQQLGDFTQKTGESDDFTQHTSGKLEFGQDSQQSYQPWKPQGADQQLGDFTHKTGEFDDFTQQTSGNLEFGQESEQSFPTWHPNVRDQKWGHLTQQTSSQPKDDLQKPAEKPKPRSRYSRRWSTVNTQVLNQDMYNINNQNNLNLNAGDTDAPNIYELPPQVNVEGDKDNIRRQSTRGDQGQDKDVSKKLSQQAGSSGYDVEGGNVDQVNWLHKSNDATVGLQWHYTYHPSDQRQFVQQTDQKNKEDLQQRSIQTQFSNLQQNPKQEEQIKYIVDNSDQQESHWQPQNYATEQGIKSVRKPFRYIQHENKLMSDQQKRENENLQKYVETASSEPKLQPRILEVYGGGQYDPTHSGDIYSGVTINPSATLPPTSNTDPWDIREKPEIMVTTTELTMPPLPVEPLNTNDTNEPPRPSSLWTRIGHKITTTFDKAKEKARNIFG
ncbi:repetin-like isoform X1 [Bombus flavifrons]|uniref:repetin-like isoform X1 n=1 Tax=Bombus flavifrons TaxID=103934 RepID=UPI003703B38F